MKKVINGVGIFLIVILLAIGCYKVFIDCNRVIIDMNQEFKLAKLDYAKVRESDRPNLSDATNPVEKFLIKIQRKIGLANNMYIKLFKITKEDCIKDNCFEKNNYDAELLIVDNHHLKYITLEKNHPIELEKFKCVIELLNSTKNEITLIVKEIEEKDEDI